MNSPIIADQFELRSIDQLIPNLRNPRRHSANQVSQITASIHANGYTNPVLIDSAGGIIAGHARVLAAREAGLDQVSVIVLGHLTEIQKRAYVIASLTPGR
jgi:ParB-like chromosome segregation protein Spo0J